CIIAVPSCAIAVLSCIIAVPTCAIAVSGRGVAVPTCTIVDGAVPLQFRAVPLQLSGCGVAVPNCTIAVPALFILCSGVYDHRQYGGRKRVVAQGRRVPPVGRRSTASRYSQSNGYRSPFEPRNGTAKSAEPLCRSEQSRSETTSDCRAVYY